MQALFVRIGFATVPILVAILQLWDCWRDYIVEEIFNFSTPFYDGDLFDFIIGKNGKII